MAMKKHSIATFTMSAVLGLGLLAGCHERAQDFSAPGDPTAVGHIADAQAAKAAVADAMLYPRHFDGPTLNSLGCRKLHMILKATPADQPVVVYLNMPKDAATGRQPAVLAYLKDAGVDADGTQIVQGSNPNLTTPTAYNLSEIYKGETGNYTGEAADANAASGAAPGAAAK